MSATEPAHELEGIAVAPADDRLAAIIDDPALRRTVPAGDVVGLLLARMDEVDPQVRAYITPMAEQARADAAAIDAGRAQGRRTALDGMPVVVKDNIDVAGVRRTVGSRLFEDHVATEDAAVVEGLRAAGAVILGKVTTHELVFGMLGHNAITGQTHNPWNLGRVPGGSSSGSGAAVAADMAIGALGSDTGGSTRLPGHYNGVTALRPTSGIVSNRGAFPIAPTFDTVGPLARAARDVAALFAATAGFDPRDPRAIEHPTPDVLRRLDGGVAGVRVGVVGGFFAEDLADGTPEMVRAAADVLAGLGAELVELELPGAAQSYETIKDMVRADALAVHREAFAATPELFSPQEAERLTHGERVSGVRMAECLELQARWRMEVRERAFGEVDLLLSATCETAAPRIGAPLVATTLSATRLTLPWALAGIPALTLPAGFDPEGMPLGAQLAAPWWGEPLLFRAGVALQGVTDWHLRRPGDS